MARFPGPPIRTPFIDYSKVDPQTQKPLGVPSWPWLQWFLSLYNTVSPGGMDETLLSALDNAYADPSQSLEDAAVSSSMEGEGRDYSGRVQDVEVLSQLEAGHTHPRDDGILFLSEGGILREMMDADARALLATSDPPRPPQTASSLGWAVLAATAPVAPDADFNVGHGLGRIPAGYVIVGRDIATEIYNGAGAWTNTNIVLKSTIGGANISLFVF